MSADRPLKILIPLDGSAPSESILPALAPLFAQGRIELTLLRVVQDDRDIFDSRRYLDGVPLTLWQQNVHFSQQVETGQPVERILDAASRGQYDFIALTTHGRTGMDRLRFGSVGESVVRSSPVPVLLCKEGDRFGSWDRILVAVDGTPGSEEILGDAIQMVERVGGEIHLLQVRLPLLRTDGYRGTHYEFPDPQHDYLPALAERLRARGVTAVVHEREGIAGVEIAKMARDLRTGLICMTTQGKPETMPGLERSVAAEVIRKAPCPVYVRRMAANAKGTQVLNAPARAT